MNFLWLVAFYWKCIKNELKFSKPYNYSIQRSINTQCYAIRT